MPGHQVIWFFGHSNFQLEKNYFSVEKVQGHQVIWILIHLKLIYENKNKVLLEQQNIKSLGFKNSKTLRWFI